MSAIAVPVTCIKKDAQGKITHIGGIRTDNVRWTRTEAQAIKDIEDEVYNYWVHVKGESVWIIISKATNGSKYLKTQKDDTTTNNLLSLAICPE